MAIGGKRTLTKGKKKGEMVYTRPDYITGKKRVQVKSDVKGGRGTKNPPRVKPTESKGQIHSAVNKEKIDKAAKAANERSKKANKYNPTKEEMVGSKTKRPANFGEIGKRQKKDKDIDKSHTTVALKHGSAGKGGTYPPTKEEMESEFLDSLKPKTPPKPKPKPKTKTKKKMGGGKVYKYKKNGSLKKTSSTKGTGTPKSKKRKLIKKQEDYATMADRGIVSKILGFSPMGEISKGISNLISDDKDELKKIRTESSKKPTSDLDTGFKGIPAPHQPSDFEKKSGGGKVYKRKHGGKTVSGNDGNSIVAACYD